MVKSAGSSRMTSFCTLAASSQRFAPSLRRMKMLPASAQVSSRLLRRMSEISSLAGLCGDCSMISKNSMSTSCRAEAAASTAPLAVVGAAMLVGAGAPATAWARMPA